MKFYLNIAFVLFATIGCETISPTIVDRYATNANNLQFLQSNGSKQVNVGSFVSVPPQFTEVECLREGIVPPDDQNYASYVRTSLISEIAAAGRYSNTGSITLTGVLEQANLIFLKKIGYGAQGGQWNFVLTVDSSNGASTTVSASHAYYTGWAPIRCHIAAEALMPAVQTLMHKLISDAEFQSLLR